MPAIGWYAVVLGVAAGVTALTCGPAAWLSRKTGYVALPGDRKIHTTVTPYGGGPAMFLGFLVAMMVAFALHPLRPLFADSSEPLGVVLAGGAIFGVGLLDDAREMSAPAKVAGQVLAASILYFLGVTLYWFKIPLGGFVSLTPSLTPLIMALWVIALANAVNLIDGLDGLAAGIVAIGGGALAVYGLRLMEIGVLSNTNIGPLIAVVACGICLGFLPFNFHPAKMFMGDAGALLLGLLMSASTMVIGGRIPPSPSGGSPTSGDTYFFFAPLLIPFFILGVPLVDMAFAFIRRTAQGTGFHTPDKNHIHHRLLRLGHGHRRSVVILWAWTAIMSGFILFPLFVRAVNPFIPLGVALLAVALVTWFHPDLRHREGDVVPAAEALAARQAGTGRKSGAFRRSDASRRAASSRHPAARRPEPAGHAGAADHTASAERPATAERPASALRADDEHRVGAARPPGGQAPARVGEAKGREPGTRGAGGPGERPRAARQVAAHRGSNGVVVRAPARTSGYGREAASPTAELGVGPRRPSDRFADERDQAR